MTEVKGIYQAISQIMKDVGAIGKDKKADPKMGGYAYRGIEGVYNGLQKIMAANDVFSVPKVISVERTERPTASGGKLYHVFANIEYSFYHSDGSSIVATVIGEGMDTGDKASNKAMSIAQKYALIQVFCLMTEDVVDPDDERPELPITPKEIEKKLGQDDFPAFDSLPEKSKKDLKEPTDETIEVGTKTGKKFSEAIGDSKYMYGIDMGMKTNFSKMNGQLKRLHAYAVYHGAINK